MWFSKLCDFLFKKDKDKMYQKELKKIIEGRDNFPEIPLAQVSELTSEIFSKTCRIRKLAGVNIDAALNNFATEFPQSVLFLSLLYLERLKTGPIKATEFIHELTSTELFVISMMVSSKLYNDDRGLLNTNDNHFWALFSELDVDLINELEYRFLDAIDWKVLVSPDEYLKHFNGMHKQISLREVKKRGFFTYSEIIAAQNDFDGFQLVNDLVKALYAVFITYFLLVSCIVLSVQMTDLIMNYIEETLHNDEWDKHYYTNATACLRQLGTLCDFQNIYINLTSSDYIPYYFNFVYPKVYLT